jgi:hypothetical protein
MLMWFRKVGFQQLIHKGFFLSDVGRRDVYSVNEGIGPVRVVWSEPFRLVPYVCAGKRCWFNVGNESRGK